MEKFEKLGEFKKAVKATIRGAVKAGVFGVDGVFTVNVCKCDEAVNVCKCDEIGKVVTVAVVNGPYQIDVTGEVATRVYNKVTSEFFAPIKAQFERLAKVERIDVTIVE